MRRFTCSALVYLIMLSPRALAGGDSSPAMQSSRPHSETDRWRLSLGGSARLRYERFNNQTLKTYGGNGDDVLYERTAINAALSIKPGFRLFAEAYGAHFFLNEYSAHDFSPACPHQNTIDISRANLEWRNIGGSPLYFKAGRQYFTFGDMRVWGPGGWANSRKYIWDGARVAMRWKPASVHIIYGRRLITSPFRLDTDHFAYHAGGVYAILPTPPTMIEPFFTAKIHTRTSSSDQSAGTRLYCYSGGAYIHGDKNSALRYGCTGVVQAGKRGAQRIQAGAANAHAAWRISETAKPTVGGSYSFASGDRDPDDEVYGTFDGLFGAAALYYGRMNQFYWMNIHALEADLSFQPLKKLNVKASYHYFALSQARDAWYRTNGKPHKSGGKPRRDARGESGRDLGHELDLVIRAKPLRGLALQAGYSHLFPGEFIHNTAASARDRSPNDWFFAQIEYSL